MTPGRSAEVDIDGYGPVLLRGLEQGEIELIGCRAAGDISVVIAEVVRRGCVRPDIYRMPDDEFTVEFTGRAEQLAHIGAAILERSWPAVQV